MKKISFVAAVALILVTIGFLVHFVIQSPSPSNTGNTVFVATSPLSGEANVSQETVLPGARPIRWGSYTNLNPDSKFVVHGLKADDLTIVGTNLSPALPTMVIPNK